MQTSSQFAALMNSTFSRIFLLVSLGWTLIVLPCWAKSEPKAECSSQESDTKVVPRSLDVHTALLLALQYSPVIAEARERIREQEGVLISAKAERRPRVDVEGHYDVTQNTRIEGFGSSLKPDEQNWSFDLVMSHVIYAGGRLAANAKSAAARVCAAENQMRMVIDGVLLETNRNYFDGLLAREVITVQQEAVTVLERRLQDTKAAFEAGARPQFDVLQAEVALANAKPPVIRAKNQYRLAVDRLRRSIGLPYEAGVEADAIQLTQSWPNAKVNEKLGELLLQGLANRPELAELAAQIQAAEGDVKAAKALHKPTVRMRGTYGTQNMRFAGDAGQALAGATGLVEFSVPIFDFGRTKGQVVQATSRLAEIEARSDQQRLSVEGEVRQAFFDYDEASQILETSQLVVKQATEALQLAQNRLRAGALIQLEFLQSQLELTRARLEHVQALHTYNVAVAQLRHAVGTISREVECGAKKE
jgi:outer membrane protein